MASGHFARRDRRRVGGLVVKEQQGWWGRPWSYRSPGKTSRWPQARVGRARLAWPRSPWTPGGGWLAGRAAAAELFGLAAGTVTGRDLRDVLLADPGQRELAGRALAEVAAGRPWTGTLAMAVAGGSPVAIRCDPLAGPGSGALVTAQRTLPQPGPGWLSEAAARIGSTLDLTRTAREVTDAAVPGFADAAAIFVPERLLAAGEAAWHRAGPATVRRLAACLAGQPADVTDDLLRPDEVIVLGEDSPGFRAMARPGPGPVRPARRRDRRADRPPSRRPGTHRRLHLFPGHAPDRPRRGAGLRDVRPGARAARPSGPLTSPRPASSPPGRRCASTTPGSITGNGGPPSRCSAACCPARPKVPAGPAGRAPLPAGRRQRRRRRLARHRLPAGRPGGADRRGRDGARPGGGGGHGAAAHCRAHPGRPGPAAAAGAAPGWTRWRPGWPTRRTPPASAPSSTPGRQLLPDRRGRSPAARCWRCRVAATEVLDLAVRASRLGPRRRGLRGHPGQPAARSHARPVHRRAGGKPHPAAGRRASPRSASALGSALARPGASLDSACETVTQALRQRGEDDITLVLARIRQS